jgi:hypothetical protein
MAKGIKTGGREKGTPNRLTKELRSVLKEIIYQEFAGLPDRLDKLEPRDRLELLIKLLPYILPKVIPLNCDYDIPNDYSAWDQLL